MLFRFILIFFSPLSFEKSIFACSHTYLNSFRFFASKTYQIINGNNIQNSKFLIYINSILFVENIVADAFKTLFSVEISFIWLVCVFRSYIWKCWWRVLNENKFLWFEKWFLMNNGIDCLRNTLSVSYCDCTIRLKYAAL